MYLREIENLAEISEKYRFIICDVWGVLHDGVTLFHEAIAALENFRHTGGKVILLTNAPKPRAIIEERFFAMGAKEKFWDALVTSGDVMRDYLSENAVGKKLYHWGPTADSGVYEGLNIIEAPLKSAELILCSGLEDSDTEVTAQEAARLQEAAERNLPFLCANPDLTVRIGKELMICAGTAAAIYARAGGSALMFGKPHALVYEKCLDLCAELSEEPVNLTNLLAIGDGLHTDIKGAEACGFDTLFIKDGVHRDHMKEESFTELREICEEHDVCPTYYTERLK